MTAPSRIPRLQAGDVMTRVEFERRYSAMPNLKHAELIEGVVYMPSPVRYSQHGRPHAVLAGWLSDYERATPGTAFGIEATFRVDLDNEVQPDLLLRRTDERATSRIDEDSYIQGVPELLIEVAASSVSYDLHQKKRVYRRAGVREYLVLRAEDAAVDWFVLRDGEYHPQEPDVAGILRSDAFPGLWLDVPALLAGDTVQLTETLARGIVAR